MCALKSLTVQSTRLLLRPFRDDDATALLALNSDPKVLEFTADAPFQDKADALDFIKTYRKDTPAGLGRYAVIRRQDEEFLGWCGLKYHPEADVVDLGYRFFQAHWKKGYATEAANAMITYGFDRLKYPFLVAHSHIKNFGSQKVLERCDFKQIKQITYDNQPAFLYKKDNPEYSIKEISARQTWPVRHPVLRKGRPLEEVYMQADEAPTTFHLGVYYKKELVGVASFMEDTHPDFEGKQARLRGMAVLPDYRKKGLAGLLLKKGENLLRQKDKDLLWFNARIVALSFYKKMGYQTIGSEFDIPLVGPHYVMKKNL